MKYLLGPWKWNRNGSRSYHDSELEEGPKDEIQELMIKEGKKIQNELIMQATKSLKTCNRIVITGGKETGKTNLAKSIADDLVKKDGTLKTVWISSLQKLEEERKKPPPQNVDIYIFDDILVPNVIEKPYQLKSFLERYDKGYLIITIETTIWEKHKTLYSTAGLNKKDINLDPKIDE